MTNVVVDSNVLFSAMLNTDSQIGQILIRDHETYSFFAPQYARSEIIEHKEKK